MPRESKFFREKVSYTARKCIFPWLVGHHTNAFGFSLTQMIAESLCSILLLEESSPRQVFTEFLLARKSALQEIFHPSQHGELQFNFEHC